MDERAQYAEDVQQRVFLATIRAIASMQRVEAPQHGSATLGLNAMIEGLVQAIAELLVEAKVVTTVKSSEPICDNIRNLLAAHIAEARQRALLHVNADQFGMDLASRPN